MGIVEVLTLIFIVLKLVGVITWSWWLVFSPILIVAGIWLAIWVGVVLASLYTGKEIKFKDKDKN